MRSLTAVSPTEVPVNKDTNTNGHGAVFCKRMFLGMCTDRLLKVSGAGRGIDLAGPVRSKGRDPRL